MVSACRSDLGDRRTDRPPSAESHPAPGGRRDEVCRTSSHSRLSMSHILTDRRCSLESYLSWVKGKCEIYVGDGFKSDYKNLFLFFTFPCICVRCVLSTLCFIYTTTFYRLLGFMLIDSSFDICRVHGGKFSRNAYCSMKAGRTPLLSPYVQSGSFLSTVT